MRFLLKVFVLPLSSALFSVLCLSKLTHVASHNDHFLVFLWFILFASFSGAMIVTEALEYKIARLSHRLDELGDALGQRGEKAPESGK
jgi:hypothetical protein